MDEVDAEKQVDPGGRFAVPVYLPVAAQQARVASIGARHDAYADDARDGPMYGGGSAASRAARPAPSGHQTPQRMAALAEEMRAMAVAAAMAKARPGEDDDDDGFDWSTPASGTATLGFAAYEN